MNFYGKRGSRYEIYFGVCPWVKISFWRYVFERLIFNQCLATETHLKARGFDLHIKIQNKSFSLLEKEEFHRIEQLLGAQVAVGSSGS